MTAIFGVFTVAIKIKVLENVLQQQAQFAQKIKSLKQAHYPQ